ncbi:electron transport complex subunit RsxC [Aliamphritea spongicola]|uniref:electron transport complex subunit RsxC n=1 Tax=Aliamphritea spongicola TaxID=707589 RepID=UPI00196A551A|nr:electron transport complex subunit RsxC [Aliamphritea spongicola]MBN3563351.1 electron transport complex subunit RsxC [Aliamphritea spongicola]
MNAQIHSFHGGIHPPENKRQSTGGTITEAPVPSRIVLPLQQHIGLPADPLVKVGDKVLKGQTVAEAIGRISANIHASTSGTVVAIEAHPVPHMSGMMADCIIIEADGEDQWTEHQGLEDYQQLPKPELIEYIRKAGVAGMGGAGFPTDVKLHLGDDHIVNTLIINAAECEPYITADDMLMRERADRILGGIEIIAHLLQPLHIIVGIEDNKPQAIRALHEAFDGCDLNLDIISVPTKYPSGGEKQLIKLLTGVEVPSGKIPADVGIVCQNVGTTTAVYDAVQHGKPLVSRVITITGQAVAHPQNLEARIGTPFADLLEYCGLSEQHLARLIVGGPMMGLTIENPQIPMIKTSNCLIAGSINEFPAQPPAQACIRCGMCEQVCPVELLPQQLHWFAKGREFEKAKHHNLFDCIECGACSYVCPSNIPLVQYYRFAKGEIRKEDAEQRKADHARLRFEARQARQEQEQLEKELRRKARAEEAAKNQAAKRDAVITKQASSTVESSEPDLKQLKTNAAVARTKLKKAEKALSNAQAKGLDGIDALQETVNQLQAKSDAAAQAYEQAQQAPAAPAAPVVDIKQLKTNAAIARTKLKKAEKQLASAQEAGADNIAELEAEVKALTEKSATAEAAFKAAESGGTPPAVAAAPAFSQAQLDDLKAAVDALQGKVEKAKAAYEKAAASDSPAAPKMADGVTKLEGKLKEAEDEYQKALEANQASAGAPAPAAPAFSQTQLDDLKADIEALQGKVEKAKAAYEKAAASDSPAAPKMADGVTKLEGKLKDAEAEYQQALQANEASAAAPAPAAPAFSRAQLDDLKADVEALQGKVEKAKAAYEKAAASDSPAAPKMADGVTKLEGKLKDAEAEYQQALQANEASQASTAAPAPAAPAFSQAQLDDLKADADAMRSKVEKAKAAYEKAVASESPAAAKMADGVAKLEGKLKEAEAEYQQALQANQASTETAAPAINNVAVEKPDAKALKQQVSIMRTKLKKAEKALDEADDSNRENLQQDVANLTARYEQAQNDLASLEAEHIAAAAAEGIDLKQLKVDAALARAAVTKAERALSKAEDDMQADLQAELLSAQEKAAELNSTLERFSK